jgi:ABC-type nitrate/sulfonate/bicarbonate transport system substrate-binding protein
VATGSVLDLLRQRKGGLGVRALTSFEQFTNPIVVPADSPIKSFADLRGKKVATPGANIFDFQIVRAAGKKAYGVDAGKDVKLTEAAPGLINKLLDKGSVDGALQFSSLTYGPIAQHKYRQLTTVPELLKAAGLDANVFYLLYNVTDDWSKAHPDKVTDLRKAIREGIDVMETDDSVWPPFAKAAGVDSSLQGSYVELVRSALRTSYSSDLIAPTQKLFDALAGTVGEASLGVTKVDPAAFIFTGDA